MVGFPFLREAFLFGIVLYIWGMQWEYTNAKDLSVSELCAMGQQGWDNYAIVPALEGLSGYIFYFKRKIS